MFFKISAKQEPKAVDLRFGGDNDALGSYSFVLNIRDIDNELGIIISSSVCGKKGTDIAPGTDKKFKKILKKSTPIYPNESDTYEIVFPDYVIYQVRKESYCSWDDYEIRKGKKLIIYEKSRLLDYYRTAVNEHLFDGECKHYGISAEHHIIDVISFESPVIRRINLK